MGLWIAEILAEEDFDPLMLIAVDGGAGGLMHELGGGGVGGGAFVVGEGSGGGGAAASCLEGEASPGGESKGEFVHGLFCCVSFG